MPVASTSQPSVQELGFASIGLLTPLRRLYPLPVRQASVLPTASSRFHLAMDTLAVRLTLPLAGRVEDFHLQVSAPAGRTKQSAPPCGRGEGRSIGIAVSYWVVSVVTMPDGPAFSALAFLVAMVLSTQSSAAFRSALRASGLSHSYSARWRYSRFRYAMASS